MQSTLTSTETDPHDIFVIEPDVVLAARADHVAAPVSSVPPPPIRPAPEFAVTAPVPPVEQTFHAAATGDIEVPRDIHVSGRPSRGRWASRAMIGFVFALGSAAAAEGWDHYGDAARTLIAQWTPFVLNSSRPPEKAAAADQPAASNVQASAPESSAATDQTPAQPAPAAQPAQDTASTAAASASTATASTDAAPVLAAAAPAPAARDLAAMSQQIEALKASIEQLKAGQEQMAQQMAQQIAQQTTRNAPPRAAQVRPSEIKPTDQSLRAKVTAALSPRPVAPPRKPRPAYPPPPGYAPQAAAALPPPVAAPPPPQSYESRAQAVDQADGDPVVRPPMPLR